MKNQNSNSLRVLFLFMFFFASSCGVTWGKFWSPGVTATAGVQWTSSELTEILSGAVPAGYSSSGLQSGFSPAYATYTETVTLTFSVTGLAAVISSVKINGVSAAISNVGTNSLAVTVPNGATSGPISISVGSASASFGTNFTVYTYYVYAANDTAASISAYSLNIQTGGLTAVSGSPFAAGGTSPRGMAFDPDGKYLFVALNGSSQIANFTINKLTGQLTANGALGAGGNVAFLAVDSTGKYAYAAKTAVADYESFTISGTGTLTNLGNFGVAANTNAIAIHPSAPFLYGTENTGTNLYAMALSPVDGNILNQLAGSPHTVVTNTTRAAVGMSGKYLYASSTGGNLYAFSINAATGALTTVPGSPFATGVTARWVTSDLTNKYVYVCNAAGTTVLGYAVNSVTGALTALAGSPFTSGTNCFGLAADYSGRYLYAANNSSNNITAFSINASTGALTQVSGSPFAAAVGTYTVYIAKIKQ